MKIKLDEISKFSNEILCEIIVTQRYLKLDVEISIEAMKELSLRRSNGSNFNFEKIIEKMEKDLPQIEVSPTFDLNTIIKTLGNI